MTGRRRRGGRHTPRVLSRSEAERGALIAAKAAGCICEPELRVRHYNGQRHLEIAHDGWCPMVDHASQVLIFLPWGER